MDGLTVIALIDQGGVDFRGIYDWHSLWLALGEQFVIIGTYARWLGAHRSKP